MLRKFRVKLNDKEYVVEMEEIGNPENIPFAQPNSSVETNSSTPSPVEEVSTPTTPVSVEGGTTVDSPMPGTILDVMVKVGDVVTENQPLLILEAMKMENNIVAPKNGVVAAIYVSKGEAIDVGQSMIVVK